MTALSLSELPLSLSYQALQAGAFNPILNPSNQVEEEAWPDAVFRYPRKLGRFVLRLVYEIAMSVLFCPVGFLYHSGKSLVCLAKSWRQVDSSKSLLMAKEHLKCALKDLSMHTLFNAENFFALLPETLSVIAPDVMVDLSSVNPSAVKKAIVDLSRADCDGMIKSSDLPTLNNNYGLYDFNIRQQLPYNALVKGAHVSWNKDRRIEIGLEDPRVVALATKFSLLVTYPQQKTPQHSLCGKIQMFRDLGTTAPHYSFRWDLVKDVALFTALIFVCSIGVSAVLVPAIISNVWWLCLIVLVMMGNISLSFLVEKDRLYGLYITGSRANEKCAFADTLKRQDPVTAGAWLLDSNKPDMQYLYGIAFLHLATRKIVLGESLFGLQKMPSYTSSLDLRKHEEDLIAEGLQWLLFAAKNGSAKAVNLLNDHPLNLSANQSARSLVQGVKRKLCVHPYYLLVNSSDQEFYRENYFPIFSLAVSQVIETIETRPKIIRESLENEILLPRDIANSILEYRHDLD
jgi:hypothetical protein